MIEFYLTKLELGLLRQPARTNTARHLEVADTSQLLTRLLVSVCPSKLSHYEFSALIS